MSRQKETLQERLQARIDKHRDPRGNICLGTYNHWDSALDLEAIGSLDAAQAEIARLKAIVRVNGLRWGHTHADIDALIGADPSASDDFRQPEAAPEGWRQRAEQIIELEKRFAEQDDKNDINIFALRLARIHTAEQILGKKPITASASAPTPASAGASEVASLPDDLEVLREVETKWLAEYLNESIARLGYPVGCGNGLNPEHAQTAARALFDRYLKMIALCRKAAPSRDAGLEEAAKICDALYGRHNEWATTTSKTVKTKADRAEMKGRADAAQFLAHRIRALASTPAPASGQEEKYRTALEDIALLDEADGHELKRDDALRAVGIASNALGKHPSEIFHARLSATTPAGRAALKSGEG